MNNFIAKRKCFYKQMFTKTATSYANMRLIAKIGRIPNYNFLLTTLEKNI